MADGHITVTVNARANEVAALVAEVKRLRGLAERAADMLTAYGELIRRDGASHVEEHHYLPEVEHTARELREWVAASEAEREARVLLLTLRA